ncbi:MAG: hypothetical protein H6577_06405 [Lewinellaceae bacterium]|nr:hypothetical protein [Saprospiraceae bacterium]MCB9337739.1 hypothetical protein [Lewinellaceae bacterium]
MSASTKIEVVVKDACIFFDLIDLRLLSIFYQLPITVITTPQVMAEIIDETQLIEVNFYIESGQLQIDQFGQYDTIGVILDSNARLSFTDASILETALRRNATVLSSDNSLRKESRRQGLKVHGLLWVLEELYNQNFIELELLITKLEEYSKINVWAPKAEIAILIKKYKT